MNPLSIFHDLTPLTILHDPLTMSRTYSSYSIVEYSSLNHINKKELQSDYSFLEKIANQSFLTFDGRSLTFCPCPNVPTCKCVNVQTLFTMTPSLFDYRLSTTCPRYFRGTTTRFSPFVPPFSRKKWLLFEPWSLSTQTLTMIHLLPPNVSTCQRANFLMFDFWPLTIDPFSPMIQRENVSTW